MRALLLILAVAAALAAGLGWLLANQRGAEFTDAFAQVFYLALIGSGVAALVWRRAEPRGEGAMQLLFYLALWGAALGGVMLIYGLFNPDAL